MVRTLILAAMVTALAVSARAAGAAGETVTFTTTDNLTITATFVKGTKTASVSWGPALTGAGTVIVDGTHTFTSTGTFSGLSIGLHTVSVVPIAGAKFTGWNLSSKIKSVGSSVALGEIVNVTGTGQVHASLTAGPLPVTFVLVNPNAGGASAVRLSIGSYSLPTGATASLSLGSYVATLSGTKAKIQAWTATSNLTLSGAVSGNATVTVGGSGTVYVVLATSGGGGGGSGGVVVSLPVRAIAAPPAASVGSVASVRAIARP